MSKMATSAMSIAITCLTCILSLTSLCGGCPLPYLYSSAFTDIGGNPYLPGDPIYSPFSYSHSGTSSSSTTSAGGGSVTGDSGSERSTENSSTTHPSSGSSWGSSGNGDTGSVAATEGLCENEALQDMRRTYQEFQDAYEQGLEDIDGCYELGHPDCQPPHTAYTNFLNSCVDYIEEKYEQALATAPASCDAHIAAVYESIANGINERTAIWNSRWD